MHSSQICGIVLETGECGRKVGAFFGSERHAAVDDCDPMLARCVCGGGRSREKAVGVVGSLDVNVLEVKKE